MVRSWWERDLAAQTLSTGVPRAVTGGDDRR